MHGSSAGFSIPITTMGGLVTLASPDSLPEGASPRCSDNDYLVGSTRTRDGLRSVYSYSGTGSTIGPNSAQSAIDAGYANHWKNPSAILGTSSYATIGAAAGNTIASGQNAINITEFSFNVPPTTSILGVSVSFKGYGTAPVAIAGNLIFSSGISGNALIANLGTSPSPVILGGPTNAWGNAPTPAIVNQNSFGVQLRASSAFPLASAFLNDISITLYATSGGANFNFISTFTAQNGDVKNLSLDANGNFWVEDVTNNPGILALALEGIAPNSYAVGVNGPDVEYLAFNNLASGSDVPRQYTANWIDRITQVGPGASPVFTPKLASNTTFPITSITQPPPNSDITDPGNLSVLLWSAGPGSTAPGNVITVYYSPGFFNGSPQPQAQDMALVNAFNSGNAVYVYLSGTPFGAGTYQVTSVGLALPPGVDHERYYFTVQTTTSSYQNIAEAPGQYQMTLATMKTASPVPGLTVGSQATVSGASVAAWDAVWPISQALNSAAMAIIETSVAGSVATYSYSVSSGTAPKAGELVTVTGTTNANLALNVVNATIVSSTGGTTGTFTVKVPVVSASAVAESGQATTAGTVFAFDPGLLTLGTTTNPIYGNSTGGTLTFGGNAAQLIGPGTRQGTVFFITRNGYYTAPAPPVIFTCPNNTISVAVSQIPIGPPNVIARAIAMTEAGQNGVPGANFFTLPTAVNYVVENVKYTATSFFINDNTTTSTTLQFPDSALLNGMAIDVQGFNLFNQIEIGNPGWIAKYDSRNFYGLCQNKIQNFNNLSFDGGYANPNNPIPLGWTTPNTGSGSLLVSPIFGNTYYIKNTTGAPANGVGLIAQSAFQDAYLQPILQPNTIYSVRVTLRSPSGIAGTHLIVALVNNGQLLPGYFDLALDGNVGSSFTTITGSLLTTALATIPSSATLQVFGQNMSPNADIEIDRIEPFPANVPVLTTTVFGSYAADPEQVDAVTGAVKFISENQQPVMGAYVLYDTFYALKESSMYSLRSLPNLEPAQWEEPEVAQKAGACGINAYDSGEQWGVQACRNGLYLYEGAQPGKISQEIFQVWDAINWNQKRCIWVRNDVIQRRLFVGVPMATPNFWLPNAPVNANPTSPNVVLMLNYQGLDTAQEIKSYPQMHTTMFGTLNAIDMRRKWSIWQIASPYAEVVATSSDQAIYFGNGAQNSKMYMLDPTMTTDDGSPINSLYTTAGIGNPSKENVQVLGAFNKRTGYMSLRATGSGVLAVTFLPDQLLGPNDSTAGYNSWAVPGGFNLSSISRDMRASVNFFANRQFVEFQGSDFNLSLLTLHMKKDPWSAPWGPK